MVGLPDLAGGAEGGGGPDGAVAQAWMERERVSTSGRGSDCSSVAAAARAPTSDRALLQRVPLGAVDAHDSEDRVGSCWLCFHSHEPPELAGPVIWQPSTLRTSDSCVGSAPVAGPRRAGGGGWLDGCKPVCIADMGVPRPASDATQEALSGTVCSPVGSGRAECVRVVVLGCLAGARGCEWDTGHRVTGVGADGVPSAQRLGGFFFSMFGCECLSHGITPLRSEGAPSCIRVALVQNEEQEQNSHGYKTLPGGEAHAVLAEVPGGSDHVQGGTMSTAMHRAHDVEQTPKNMFTSSAPSAVSTDQLNPPPT